MNQNQKDLLDKQGDIISALSVKEIHALLAGEAPLEAGEFISAVIQGEYFTGSFIFDMDAVTYMLRSKAANSAKFDEKVIKNLMNDHDLSKEQARAMVAMRNHYLVNDISQTGINYFVERFKSRFEDFFEEFVRDILSSAVDKWRGAKDIAKPEDIEFNKLPVFVQMKKEYIQSQSSGRPVGATAKDMEKDSAKKKHHDDLHLKLIMEAALKEMKKNPQKALTFAGIAKQIIKQKNSGDPKQTSTEKSVTGQTISNWCKELSIDMQDMETLTREQLKNKKRFDGSNENK